MNTGDKKETPLADLGIALRKMFPCLPLHVIGNVFYPKTSCFVPKTCAAFFFRNLLCIILYHLARNKISILISKCRVNFIGKLSW